MEKEYFLTLSIAAIDRKGKIRYSNAGHLPLLHYKKSENKFVDINPKGIGIGFNDRGMFEKTLAEEKVKTECGDILCFYTDGVTEAMNHAKVQFGQARLEKVIEENCDKPIDEIKTIIIQTVNGFRGTAEVNDDISIVLLKAK